MRQVLFIIALFLITAFTVLHAQPAMRFGVEWGISNHFHERKDVTFFTEDKAIVNYSQNLSDMHLNGEILTFSGIDIADLANISIYTGWSGVMAGHRIFPVELRSSFSLNKSLQRGNIVFTGIGYAIDENKRHKNGVYARVGYSYRFYLGTGVSLDLCGAYRLVYSHPNAKDFITGETIPYDRLGKSYSLSGLLTLSIGLNFDIKTY